MSAVDSINKEYQSIRLVKLPSIRSKTIGVAIPPRTKPTAVRADN
jgi:hypothetical protein